MRHVGSFARSPQGTVHRSLTLVRLYFRGVGVLAIADKRRGVTPAGSSMLRLAKHVGLWSAFGYRNV